MGSSISNQRTLTKDSTITLNNGVRIPMVGLGTWGGFTDLGDGKREVTKFENGEV